MSPEAGTLRCPHCGAPAEPGRSRCRYCRARLALASCPACFAKVFEGTRFCPSCGGAVARADKGPAEVGCPGCGAGLHHVEVGRTPLLECRACDGVWLDAPVFESLCADGEAQAPVLHHVARRTAVVATAAVRYRPCVRCGKMMNRVNFARMSGTIVDVCKGHGTFLDAGELHAILSFIGSGGLARAREREREDLQEARRRLEEAQAVRGSRRRGAAEFAQPPRSGWDAQAIRRLLARLKV